MFRRSVRFVKVVAVALTSGLLLSQCSVDTTNEELSKASQTGEYPVASYIVTASPSLNIRSFPDLNGTVLIKAPYNDRVGMICDVGNGWFRVAHKNVVGYAFAQWLRFQYGSYLRCGATPPPPTIIDIIPPPPGSNPPPPVDKPAKPLPASCGSEHGSWGTAFAFGPSGENFFTSDINSLKSWDLQENLPNHRPADRKKIVLNFNQGQTVAAQFDPSQPYHATFTTVMPMSGKYRITVGLEGKARVNLSFYDNNLTFKDRRFSINNKNENNFTWIKRTGAEAFEVEDPKCFVVVAKYEDFQPNPNDPNKTNLIVEVEKED